MGTEDESKLFSVKRANRSRYWCNLRRRSGRRRLEREIWSRRFGEEDSYQGMPSGMPISANIMPALAAAYVADQTQRLKPCDAGGT
jgi:hypothetical protein